MSLQGQAAQVGENGLSKVAHAIRRSVALYVAMSISDENTTLPQLKNVAEELAAWIGGRAAANETPPGPSPFLGKDPWAED